MKLLAAFLLIISQTHADIISSIQNRGYLRCGVTTGLPGFSYITDKGKWEGFDVDICRSIAASLFDDPSKVKFIPLTNQMKFNALQNQKVDVLSRVTSLNYSSDQKTGLIFVGVTYFDTQRIMVYKQPKVKKLTDLDGLTVCLISGTSSERNLVKYARKNQLNFETISFETGNFVLKALKNGRCEALSTDQSALYILKKSLKNPQDAFILSESIGFEPLALMIRDDDPIWFKHIRWVIFTLIKGEQDNIGFRLNNTFLKESNIPANYSRILRYVGNYKDIFNRNLGDIYKIPRELNALYVNGGLMYAPDFS